MESTAEKIKELENRISECESKIFDITLEKQEYNEQLINLKKKEKKEDIVIQWEALHRKLCAAVCLGTQCQHCPLYLDTPAKRGDTVYSSCLLNTVSDVLREALNHD